METIQIKNMAGYVFNYSLALIFKWQNMFSDKIEWTEVDKENRKRATSSFKNAQLASLSWPIRPDTSNYERPFRAIVHYFINIS